jgi:hypothetical protein
MTAIAETAFTRRVHQPALVSAPAMKFAIGLVAAISAVFFPRMIAALTAADHPRVTFISPAYFFLALSFSVLVAIAVMILEWRVPRAPRDTFMTTLGLPAMLAGALSASQGTTNLVQAAETEAKLTEALVKIGGIEVKSTSQSSEPAKSGTRNGLVDAIVAPAYAEGRQPDQPAQQPARLGIYVNEPGYFIVLDRAAKREDAQARMTNLTARLDKATPQSPVALQVERQGAEFLVVVSGGPRPKSAALLEALRLKDTYHVAPTLVEKQPTK